MAEIQIKTEKKRDVVDITDEVAMNVGTGAQVAHIFAAHTTCAITIADMDPGTDQDYLNAFDEMVPDIKFNHPHDPAHMPDHVLSALIGVSVTVPLKDGELQLGSWQRIVLLEFDGPRQRKIIIS